jgi:hypothetical protein
MLKVSDAVKEAVFNSDVALSSLADGVLNLSAYAKQIHRQIERTTMKSVKLGTIVAALARLGQNLDRLPLRIPEVTLRDIAAKSGLCEIAFEQTLDARENLKKLYSSNFLSNKDFFTVTHGVGELAIITSEKHKAHILQSFRGQKPKMVFEKLCAVTVRFDEHYIHTPGQTFWLVRKIALRHLNIVEIVSTFTELTFLLHEIDIEKAFATFTPYLRREDANACADKH